MDWNRGSGEKATTEWGFRDKRNGYIDSTTLSAVKKLFENHHNHGINFEKYFDIPIDISEEGIPQMFNFCDCEVHEALLQNLKRFGYDKPTPIQQYAIPVSLLRRDLMACAQTGSGKTAAYLYPLVAKMLQDGPPPEYSQRSSRPVAVILAPTRELCLQIYDEGLKFTYMTGIRVTAVYGGAPISEQEKKLLEGSDIIIATPGRLIDFIEKNIINLYIVRYLILDEADRMLDMGFEPQVIRILTAIKKVDRETIMCSATFPPDIQKIAHKYLNHFVKLSVGRVGSTTENITQKLMLVRHREKEDFLISLLGELQGQILLFVEKKMTANDLNNFLVRQGVKCSCIHGDRSQAERERALNDFKSQKISILIATDVASRGLDIPNVSYVIIYDLPNSIESYVHRIGRTGRIGNTGVAITLIEDRSSPVLQDLMKILQECHQTTPEWLTALSFGEMMDNSWYSVPKIVSQRRHDNFESYPKQGFNEGYRQEHNQGYNRGYNQGYNRGSGFSDASRGYGRGSEWENEGVPNSSNFPGQDYRSNNMRYNRRDDYQSSYNQRNFNGQRGRGNYRGESSYNNWNNRSPSDRQDSGRGYRGRGNYQNRGYRDRQDNSSWGNSDWASSGQQRIDKPEAPRPTYENQDPWAEPDKNSWGSEQKIEPKFNKPVIEEEKSWGGNPEKNISRPQFEDDPWQEKKSENFYSGKYEEDSWANESRPKNPAHSQANNWGNPAKNSGDDPWGSQSSHAGGNFGGSQKEEREPWGNGDADSVKGVGDDPWG